MGIRSKGTNEPKSNPQAVNLYTANSGPEGPPLRKKYTQHSIKQTRSKTSGNSGNCGRAWRRKQRGHSGGQVSLEEKRRREMQSALDAARRNREMPTSA